MLLLILGFSIPAISNPELSSQDKERAKFRRQTNLERRWGGWEIKWTKTTPYISSVPVVVDGKIEPVSVCASGVELERDDESFTDFARCKPTGAKSCPSARDCFFKQDFYSYANMEIEDREDRTDYLKFLDEEKARSFKEKREEEAKVMADYEVWYDAFDKAGITSPRIFEIVSTLLKVYN